MRCFSCAVGLLFAAHTLVGARVLHEEREGLVVGVYNDGSQLPLAHPETDGSWGGYEGELLEYLTVGNLDLDVKILPFSDLDDVVPAIQNETVDFFIGGFTVTPQRSEEVTFVVPYYGSAGASLFAPGGSVPASSWEDMYGMRVCVHKGYYAIEVLEELGLEVIEVATPQEAADLIAVGKAVACVDDSTANHEAYGLELVRSIKPILRLPFGIAAKQGNTKMLEPLAINMMQLVQGGDDAIILRLEKETLGAAGILPNPDVAALVADPSMRSLLNPNGWAEVGQSSVVRWGLFLPDNDGDTIAPLAYQVDNSTYEGFEPRLLRSLMLESSELSSMEFQMVRLPTRYERLASLQEGRVDIVMGAFVVMEERKLLIDYIQPHYYSASFAMFSPTGTVEGVNSWSDLRGKVVAIPNGHSSADWLKSLGAETIQVGSTEEALQLIKEGTVVALVETDLQVHDSQGLLFVTNPGKGAHRVISLAVQKGNTHLANKLSRALLDLTKGGFDSRILQIEAETFGLAGWEPNPDLAALVNNPQEGATLLFPGFDK